MEPVAVAAMAAVMEPNRDPPPSAALLEALLRLLSKSPRVCAGRAGTHFTPSRPDCFTVSTQSEADHTRPQRIATEVARGVQWYTN
jgi:hypothetical protein